MCEATKDNGATEKRMIQLYRQVCRAETKGKDELAEAALAAQQALVDTNALTDELLDWFIVLNIVLLVLLAVSRLGSRILRLIPGVKRALVVMERAPVLVTFLRTRRAANDAVVETLRQALARAA